jgi:hypothetical protein
MGLRQIGGMHTLWLPDYQKGNPVRTGRRKAMGHSREGDARR